MYKRVQYSDSAFTALFTIAKTWKQPKCSTDEWIEKMWYIYNIIIFGHKNEILPSVVTWRYLEVIKLSEVSQTEKNKSYMPSLTCGL